MLCCSIAGILIANLLAVLRLRSDGSAVPAQRGIAAWPWNWTAASAGAVTLGFTVLGAVAIVGEGGGPLGHICAFLVR